MGFVIGSIKRVLNIMDKQTNASLKLMYTNEGKSETATKTSNPFFKNIPYYRRILAPTNKIE